jgi:hypothetical protein
MAQGVQKGRRWLQTARLAQLRGAIPDMALKLFTGVARQQRIEGLGMAGPSDT